MSVYSVTQTANLCQVSSRTVQRRIPQLEAAGAWKDPEGKWSIPVEAMAAAGLTPGRPAPPDSPVRHQRRHQPGQRGQRAVSKLESQVTQLQDQALESERQAAEWRRRVEVAEAIAAERAETITALRQTIRALQAPPNPPVTPSVTSSPPASAVLPRLPLWSVLDRLRRS